MKTFSFTLLFIVLISISACKKSSNNLNERLALLQHKWMLVSENGEAFRYVGTPEDYYNFVNNNFLYRHVNNADDTAAYVLRSDGNVLSIYGFVNGVKADSAQNFTITTLSDSQLIISKRVSFFNVTDSLKR